MDCRLNGISIAKLEKINDLRLHTGSDQDRGHLTAKHDEEAEQRTAAVRLDSPHLRPSGFVLLILFVLFLDLAVFLMSKGVIGVARMVVKSHQDFQSLVMSVFVQH